MAIRPPRWQLTDDLAKAMGLDIEGHRITRATLTIASNSNPTVTVEYVITDETIPAVAKALAKYELRRIEDD